ncbi:hypothetical protein P775_04035 [Puniceibacterium antarcticum]|uniref:Uncharacterized protein n=1 Tax=Puniceibacterium antarcticum TaxID=1206336 RepID=A0A2G8RJ33_9RHOB|nr:hypothetical protein [Puniceibacterium antarcticum]PIL21512.1 hypothetical protein P775_04035 [Puniceibacterium antarcticum]
MAVTRFARQRLSAANGCLLHFVTGGIWEFRTIIEELLEHARFAIGKGFGHIGNKSPFVKAGTPLRTIYKAQLDG